MCASDIELKQASSPSPSAECSEFLSQLEVPRAKLDQADADVAEIASAVVRIIRRAGSIAIRGSTWGGPEPSTVTEAAEPEALLPPVWLLSPHRSRLFVGCTFML